MIPALTPDEIAAQLIADIQQAPADILQITASWRPRLDMQVLAAITNRAVDMFMRNAQEALYWVNIAEAVANTMDSDEARAWATWKKGSAYNYLNRYEEALVCWQQAERFYAKQADHLKVAGLQVNQVIGLRELGNYPAALVMAERARAACLALGEKAEMYLANLETMVGWIQQDMGDPQAALATYQRARTIYAQRGHLIGQAMADANRAYVLQEIDRFEEAETILRQVRTEIAEGDYPQELARTDLKLGILASKRGQYQEALHFLEAAHDGFAAIPLPVEVANVDNHRSFVYRQLNLLAEQVNLAKQASRVFIRQKMTREYVSCLLNLGAGYQRLNLLPEAERVLVQARRLIVQQGAKAKLLLVDTNRAEVALTAHQLERARRLARRVAKQFTVEEDPSLAARLQLVLAGCAFEEMDWQLAYSHAVRALALAETYRLPIYMIQAHYRLGRLFEMDNDLTEAQRSFRQAIETTEQLRACLLHDEFQIGFMEDKQPIYTAHVRLAHLLLLQGKSGSAELLDSLSQAFTAPLLHATTETVTEAPPTKVQLARQERLRALRESWHWYQNRLEPSNQMEAVWPDEKGSWQQQLQQIEQEIGHLIRLGRGRKGDQNNPTQLEDPAAFLTDIQKNLPSGEALLIYYMAEGSLQALWMNQADIKTFPNLVHTHLLDRWLRGWRFSLRQANPNLVPSQGHLARLYQLLLAPLEANLAGGNRLYLVLPPEWHDLPLAAAFDGHHYLTEYLQLLYLSTPRALPSRHSQRLPFVTAADRPALVVGFSESGRLPYAVAEAEQVADTLMAHSYPTTTLVESEATIDRFRSFSTSCRLLHLATHALFRPDNPMFSSIRLADGRITVADLYEMTLPGHPLVVLSACETGRGRPRGGGLLGMGRAFLAAGASGLVATLWPVSDSASAGVMATFYQALLSSSDRLDSAAALQAAQRKAIAQYQLPFYWAGFICVGG
jgi:CHAT domain-containing protein/tetratricopeptide (TPR) repeat protein